MYHYAMITHYKDSKHILRQLGYVRIDIDGNYVPNENVTEVIHVIFKIIRYRDGNLVIYAIPYKMMKQRHDNEKYIS